MYDMYEVCVWNFDSTCVTATVQLNSAPDSSV